MRFWGPSTGSAGGIREPAVAGRFYPGRAEHLAREVDDHVEAARAALRDREESARSASSGRALPGDGGRLVAVIAPHAGYVYSGPTAGYAYASIDPAQVERVVLLGPAHFVAVDGIGLSTAAAWRTPLGDVPLDADVADLLAREYDVVGPADDAHGPEHSLEVQVPFLQRVLDEGWHLVPLIVGADLPDEVSEIVTSCAAMPRTLVVVSTDLSHYLGYEEALAQDGRTIRSVVHRRPGAIGTSDACGRHPLRGLLTAAEAQGWTVRLLDARNSGDTAGDRDRVVGYAAFSVTAGPATEPPDTPAAGTRAGTGRAEPPSGRVPPESRDALLALARRTIEDALAAGGRRPDFAIEDWSGADRVATDPVLTDPGAAFVTLRSASGDLLGCIGSLTARQPLVADVAEHAFDAAFRDPRFPAMTRERARGMVIDISVLSPSRPFPCADYADLRARIPVGSGLVVSAGRHRATFLPAVWEQLPDPDDFLAALWRKAGLAPGEWPRGTQIEVYESEEFAEA